jgi:hypothetical protein
VQPCALSDVGFPLSRRHGLGYQRFSKVFKYLAFRVLAISQSANRHEQSEGNLMISLRGYARGPNWSYLVVLGRAGQHGDVLAVLYGQVVFIAWVAPLGVYALLGDNHKVHFFGEQGAIRDVGKV